MNINIKKYEAFVLAAELGGLTKAANYLGLTQSGMSHIISSLEADFGFPLLVRNRSGAKLTDAGEKVLPLVKAIVEKNAQLEHVAESIRGSTGGMIRLGAFTSVAVNWLPDIIKQFQLENPDAEFKLLNGDYHDVEQWLAEGSVDAAFVSLPLKHDFNCVPLHEDRLMAVMPKDHPLAVGDVVPVSAIEGFPFISLLESSDQDSRRTLEKAGVKPNIKFTTKDDYAIIAMVQRGLGMTIMPELLLSGHVDRVVIKELSPSASRTIALATPSGVSPDSPTGRFVAFTARWVTKNVNKE